MGRIRCGAHHASGLFKSRHYWRFSRSRCSGRRAPRACVSMSCKFLLSSQNRTARLRSRWKPSLSGRTTGSRIRWPCSITARRATPRIALKCRPTGCGRRRGVCAARLGRGGFPAARLRPFARRVGATPWLLFSRDYATAGLTEAADIAAVAKFMSRTGLCQQGQMDQRRRFSRRFCHGGADLAGAAGPRCRDRVRAGQGIVGPRHGVWRGQSG